MCVLPVNTLRPYLGVFTINAGKFPNPMFRVGEMVFDEDLSPEGLNQTVQLLGQPCGPGGAAGEGFFSYGRRPPEKNHLAARDPDVASLRPDKQ